MAEGSGRGFELNGRIIVLVLAAAALLAFVVQNTEDVRFNWLMIEITMPLWMALVIAAVLGAIVANLGSWMLRRRD
jgi:uncharacterized integral membrane protein